MSIPNHFGECQLARESVVLDPTNTSFRLEVTSEGIALGLREWFSGLLCHGKFWTRSPAPCERIGCFRGDT